MVQEKRLGDEVEKLREFTYLCYMVCAVEKCNADVSVRTRYGWIRFWECSDLMYGKRFLLKRNVDVHMRYIRAAILSGCDELCL